jgi:hypothetical protein
MHARVDEVFYGFQPVEERGSPGGYNIGKRIQVSLCGVIRSDLDQRSSEMYCGECGKEIPADSEFCGFCGAAAAAAGAISP